jgi:TRAP-type C4-dicarboxylate transport system permease small subunit
MNSVGKVSRFLNAVAGVSLVFMMLITVLDVFLRPFGASILGTYEIVSVAGVLVYGFAFPLSSWTRQHITADFVVAKLSQRTKDVLNAITRVIVLSLFFWSGWNVMKYGASLQHHGEVTPAVHLPYYPFAYALGICLFVQCAVFVCDLIKIYGRTYDMQ